MFSVLASLCPVFCVDPCFIVCINLIVWPYWSILLWFLAVSTCPRLSGVFACRCLVFCLCWSTFLSWSMSGFLSHVWLCFVLCLSQPVLVWFSACLFMSDFIHLLGCPRLLFCLCWRVHWLLWLCVNSCLVITLSEYCKQGSVVFAVICLCLDFLPAPFFASGSESLFLLERVCLVGMHSW